MEKANKSDINLSLEERKEKVKREICDIKTLSLDEIEKLEKLDDTNGDLLKAKLDLNRTDDLLIKSFDILTKEDLKKYNVEKELSNRDAYFYFLRYIRNVKILDEEGDHISQNSDSQDKMQPQILIDLSSGKMKFERIDRKKIDDTKQITSFNKEDKYNQNISYEKFIQKKKMDIKKFFKLGEEITILNLRDKLVEYQEILTYSDIYRKSFADFESELFFHYQLKNIIMSFLDCKKNEDFLDKINLIAYLYKLVKKVENNMIKDPIILSYFYFVMDLEIELSSLFENKLANYSEEKINFKNAQYISEENKLIIFKKERNSNIVIENCDCYDLDEEDIQCLIDGEIKLPLKNEMYSVKGHLLLHDLTEREGNIIYENFLPSNLLKDIIYKLYGIEKEIFGLKNVIKTFKNNTYYFPIRNYRYSAYTDKECFKIFLDYKIKNKEDLRLFDKRIRIFIQKAFLIINLEHEFGHSHLAFLYFYDCQNEDFDSPIVKIVLNIKDQVEIQEGGLLFEYLMYGREIKELSLKEVIYINNLNNFTKSLKDFRDDFINLDKEPLNTIFEKEGKNNKEISEIFEIYRGLPLEEKNKLEAMKFKSGKINENSLIDLENMKFSSVLIKAPHIRKRKNYKISRFTISNYNQ